MRRFKSLILLFSSLIGVAWSQSADKPNIVIMMADDLGYGDLACFGHKVIQTPNLDKLAKKGARLTSFYSAHSTCSPSRAGMMSGRNPFRSGIYTYIGANSCVNLRAQEVTIGEICKKAGYSTAFFGKWGLIGDMDDKSQAFPNDQGFDHWFATHNNALPSHKDPKISMRMVKLWEWLKGLVLNLWLTGQWSGWESAIHRNRFVSYYGS